MNVTDIFKKGTKVLCEKPITEKQVKLLINKYSWRPSQFTHDCVLASKQFKKQAKQFSHYSDSFLLRKMIVDERNANAYLWNSLEVAKYEAIYHVKFYEDRFDIWNSEKPLLVDFSNIANTLHYEVSNGYVVRPLLFSDYNINGSQKNSKNS